MTELKKLEVIKLQLKEAKESLESAIGNIYDLHSDTRAEISEEIALYEIVFPINALLRSINKKTTQANITK